MIKQKKVFWTEVWDKISFQLTLLILRKLGIIPKYIYIYIYIYISSSSCSERIRFDSCSFYPQNEIGPSIGRPMCLRPFGLYCSACLGIVFVSILCMCCSHFSWYCFISFTVFSAPVFSPNTLVFFFIYIYSVPTSVCSFSLFYSGWINNERRECGYYSSEIKVVGSAHTATAGEWLHGSNYYSTVTYP